MGSANSIYALSTKTGVPLANTQGELIPLQRHVLELSILKEQEQYEELQEGNSGGVSPQVNSAAQPAGGGGDTTTFVNVGSDE